MPAAHRYVRVRVGNRGIANEHGVALGVVAGTCGAGLHLHQAPVAVAAPACADALAHNAAACVLAHVQHLGSCTQLSNRGSTSAYFAFSAFILSRIVFKCCRMGAATFYWISLDA